MFTIKLGDETLSAATLEELSNLITGDHEGEELTVVGPDGRIYIETGRSVWDGAKPVFVHEDDPTSHMNDMTDYSRNKSGELWFDSEEFKNTENNPEERDRLYEIWWMS